MKGCVAKDLSHHGSTGTPPNKDWALARLSSAGELDDAFGVDGGTSTSMGQSVATAHDAVSGDRRPRASSSLEGEVADERLLAL